MKITVNEKLLSEASFRSVKIGNQVWMASDLKIDDGGEGIDKLAGYTFYTWDAAKRIADATPGWRLPTKQECEELIKYCEDQGFEAPNALRSTTTWKPEPGEEDDPLGTNDVGFGARRAGKLSSDHAGRATRYNYKTFYWTSTAAPGGAKAHYVLSISPMAANVADDERDSALITVRLIKE